MRSRMLPLVVVATFLLVQAAAIVLSSPARAGGPPPSTAPTTNNPVSGTILNAPSKTVYDYNAGSGSDRVLVVVVGSDDRTDKMSTITYGGVQMVESGRQLVGGTAQGGVQIFYLYGENLYEGSNNLVFTASATDYYTYTIAYVSGASASDPIGATGSNSSTGSSLLSVSTVPEADDSLIIAGFVSDSTSAFTASDGSSEVGDLLSSGIRGGFFTKVAPYAGDPVSVAASGGYDQWGALSLEIKQQTVELPTVSIVATDEDATRPAYQYDYNGDDGFFTFTRTGSTASSLEISFDRDGTAYYGDDYDFGDDTTCQGVSGDGLVIPSGDESCTLAISPQEDEGGEGAKTVEIQLETWGQYELDLGSYQATVYINQYDPGSSEGYTVAAPYFASMLLYDADTVAAGSVTNFSHTPVRVRAGQSATLTWTISGMTSCSVSPDIGPVSYADGTHSSTTPAITARTTYTLSCSDGTGALAPQTTTVGIVPSFIEQ